MRQKLEKKLSPPYRSEHLLVCICVLARTRLLVSNLFWALSHQWDERTPSVLFWAGSHRMKGCVCFCWTCCNGHIPVGGGLCWAITWPRGAHAFTQHTQGLSRHVSHSQSYSTDWAEVRWREAGVRRGGGGSCRQTAKMVVIFEMGNRREGSCAVGTTKYDQRRRIEISIAELCLDKVVLDASWLFFFEVLPECVPAAVLSGPRCLDKVRMQIAQRCGKSDAQLWNCGTLPLNAQWMISQEKLVFDRPREWANVCMKLDHPLTQFKWSGTFRLWKFWNVELLKTWRADVILKRCLNGTVYKLSE